MVRTSDNSPGWKKVNHFTKTNHYHHHHDHYKQMNIYFQLNAI